MAFLPVMALSAVSGWAGAALLRGRRGGADSEQQPFSGTTAAAPLSPFGAADAFAPGAGGAHTPPARLPAKRARGSAGGDAAGGGRELSLLSPSPGGNNGAGSLIRYAPPPPSSYDSEPLPLLLWDPSQASPPVLACVAAQTLQRWSLTHAAMQLHSEQNAFCCSAAGAHAARYSGAGGPLDPAPHAHAPQQQQPTVMNLNVHVNSSSESVAPAAAAAPPPPAAVSFGGADGTAAAVGTTPSLLRGVRARALRAALTVLAWELAKAARRRRRAARDAASAPHAQRTVAVLGHAAWRRAAATPLGSMLLQPPPPPQAQRRRRGGGKEDEGVVQKFGLFVL
jgi:hypothetical protein